MEGVLGKDLGPIDRLKRQLELYLGYEGLQIDASRFTETLECNPSIFESVPIQFV
jgi:hypothetical protein